MAAHGSDFQRLAIGHAIGLSEETERILDAVTLQTRAPGTLLGLFERRADIDGQAEIRSLQFFNESDNRISIVKDGSYGARTRNAIHYRVEVRSMPTAPMHAWIQFLRGV